MQTIGLAKCKLKNLKYYNKISKDLTINIEDLKIDQVSSVIINTSIDNMEFLKNISYVKILININLRIIYSKCDDNSLYVYDKNLLEIGYINIESNLDGIDTNIAFIKNKIKCEIFTENLSYKLLNTNLICVSYILIPHLKINPSFCLAYCINNNFSDNLFLSYSDGKNLTQQTFSIDLNYENILWQTNSSNIVFIGSKDDSCYIHVLDYNSKAVNKTNTINVSNIINSFCFYNSNTLILSIKEEDKDTLYRLNLKQNIIKKYPTPNISNNYTKPYFSSSLYTLFCICKLNDINCLCSIDKNNNLNILFNFSNVTRYFICEDANKIFFESIKNTQSLFYTLDIESKTLNSIAFDFIYDKVLKFKYFKNKYNDEIVLVMYSYNSKNYLSYFNISNSSSNLVYSNEDITDFDINKYTFDVFVSISNNGISQVIKINNSSQTELLKVPSHIKCISAK